MAFTDNFYQRQINKLEETIEAQRQQIDALRGAVDQVVEMPGFTKQVFRFTEFIASRAPYTVSKHALHWVTASDPVNTSIKGKLLGVICYKARVGLQQACHLANFDRLYIEIITEFGAGYRMTHEHADRWEQLKTHYRLRSKEA